MACDRSEDFNPRRTDPGSRRRFESRDTRFDDGAGRARAGDYHDFVGTAGDSRHERSNRGDASGNDCGRAFARRSHATEDSVAGGQLMTTHRREISVALAIFVLALVLVFVAPGYFSSENLIDLFLANVPVLIVALGMTLVLIIGQIDISVGSIFAICAISAGVFAKSGAPAAVAGLG